MTKIIKPSVLEQLESIRKNFEELEKYEEDVCGEDYTDAIFYSRMQDLMNEQITEIKSRMNDHECSGALCIHPEHETTCKEKSQA